MNKIQTIPIDKILFLIGIGKFQSITNMIKTYIVKLVYALKNECLQISV